MKIAITGVRSFVGYHLAAGLSAAGHEVVALLGPHHPAGGIRVERTERLARAGIAEATLDVTDAASVASCIATLRPDVFIQHEGYTTGYTSPDFDLRVAFSLNVEPLRAVFEALAACGGAAIVTGSVSEYSDSDEPHREDEACVPSLPYGLSKLAETLYAQQLSQRLGVPARVARVFLPFGPLEEPERLLSALVDKLRHGQPIQLSPGHQRRDFIHTDDVVSLYVRLVDDLARGGFDIFNVCSGESPELRDVVLEFAAALGADPALCEFGAIPMRPGEAPVIRGSNAKARALGWAPMNWRDGVRKLCAADTPA